MDYPNGQRKHQGNTHKALEKENHRKSCEHGIDLDIIFIDFQHAFGSLGREHLFNKKGEEGNVRKTNPTGKNDRRFGVNEETNSHQVTSLLNLKSSLKIASDSIRAIKVEPCCG